MATKIMKRKRRVRLYLDDIGFVPENDIEKAYMGFLSFDFENGTCDFEIESEPDYLLYITMHGIEDWEYNFIDLVASEKEEEEYAKELAAERGHKRVTDDDKFDAHEYLTEGYSADWVSCTKASDIRGKLNNEDDEKFVEHVLNCLFEYIKHN